MMYSSSTYTILVRMRIHILVYYFAISQVLINYIYFMGWLAFLFWLVVLAFPQRTWVSFARVRGKKT